MKNNFKYIWPSAHIDFHMFVGSVWSVVYIFFLWKMFVIHLNLMKCESYTLIIHSVCLQRYCLIIRKFGNQRFQSGNTELGISQIFCRTWSSLKNMNSISWEEISMLDWHKQEKQESSCFRQATVIFSTTEGHFHTSVGRWDFWTSNELLTFKFCPSFDGW